MWSRRDKGLHYEQQALDWLSGRGLDTVQQNYHCRQGEIDLIMLDADDLCFIEVKYRHSSSFGGARSSIPPSKQRKIVHCALQFITTHSAFQHHNMRFDALLITPDNRRELEFEWIQNAFSGEI